MAGLTHFLIQIKTCALTPKTTIILGQLGLVDLRLLYVVPTRHMEFIAVLGA
jgi:hypothetical protein